MQDEYVAVTSGVIVDDCIWAPGDRIPGLFKIDLKTWQIDVFPMPLCQTRWYSFIGISYAEGKLYLYPWNTHGLAEYDIKNNSWENYTPEDPNAFTGNNFNSFLYNKGKIYCIPSAYDTMLVFDTNKKTFIEKKIRNKISEILKKKYTEGICKSAVIVDDELLMVLAKSNKFIMLSLIDESISIKQLLYNEEVADNIAVFDNKLYVMTDLGNIYLYNLDDKSAKIVYRNVHKGKYSHFYISGNKLLMIPKTTDTFVFFDLDSKNEAEIPISVDFIEGIENWGMNYFWGFVVKNNHVYVLPRTMKSLIDINMYDGSFIQIKMEIEADNVSECLIKWMQNSAKGEETLSEDQYGMDLKLFCNSICDAEADQYTDHSGKQCGSAIYMDFAT